ncbi:hypothetical protein D7Y21_08820 [Corallococcus sp. AB045]|nr:hypothetical protein D7Y21_08820 [Corallococcus sp. AB045]
MLGACLLMLSACVKDYFDVVTDPDAGADAGPTEPPPPVIPEGHTLLTPSAERQTVAWDAAVTSIRFAFVARAGRHYDFAAEGRSQGYVLTLRDAASVTLSQFGPSKSGVPFTWHWSGLSDGAVYTVELTQESYAAGESLSFRFVDQGPDDHGDLPLAATPWVPSEQPLTGRGEHAGEQDTFAFETVADHVYAIDCAFPTGDWQLSFFKLTEGYYSVVGSFPFTQTRAATAIRSQGGRHVVSIQDRSPAPSSGTYSCVLRDMGLDDHGNLLTTATQLPRGTTSAQGKLDYVEDVDVFDLEVVPGRFYRVSCTLEDSKPCIVHAKPGFEQSTPRPGVTFEAGGSLHTVWTQGDGVVPAQWRALPYTLQFEDLGPDDHGNFPFTATPLTGPSQTVRAHLFVPVDHDVFSFETTAGQRYQFSSPWREGQGQVRSIVTNMSGVDQEVPRAHIGSNWVQTFTAPTTGTYCINFSADVDTNLGEYTFQFEALTP